MYPNLFDADLCGLRNSKIAGYRGIVHHLYIRYRYT